MSNYRLVRKDDSNTFYKVLAVISTVGIIAITGIQVSNAFKKGNSTDDQLAKIMIEIQNARKESLADMEMLKADLVKELNAITTQRLIELNKDNSINLKQVEMAQNSVMAEIKTIRQNILNELKEFECREIE